MAFTAYNVMFVLPLHVTLTFALVTLTMASQVQPMYQFLASQDFIFLSHTWLNLVTFSIPETVTAHAPSHVTHHQGERGGKNYPRFLNSW